MLLLRAMGVWLASIALASAVIVSVGASEAGARSQKVAKPTTAKQTGKRAPARAAPASIAANPNVVGRDAMLLIDAESGRELEAHSADELRHPASLAKIMTLYVVFGALDAGQLRLGDRVQVSARAGAVQPSKMGAPVGGSLMVRDAIMGLITRSANDAAVVLAEAIAGDEESFAQLMTQKARQLGMSSTVFRNASGLPSTYQVTTARDLARLAQATLRDFPHYYPLFSTRAWPWGRQLLTNHNRMLANYPGADGIKTGYINASGFNLVMSAQRDNRRLIGVVLGGSSVGERDVAMADMMTRGFDQARAMGVAAWRPPAPPASARYTAINFAPGAPPAEPQIQIARPLAPSAGVPTTGRTIPDATTLAMTRLPAAQGSRSDAPGGWAIQLGAFATRPAADSALRTALSRLPELRGDARPTVEPLKGAKGQTLYRARLTNLDESDASRGCQTLKAARLFHCTPVAAEARAE